ncbi:MAG: toprim domain-containing protein [Patescibacteria group bacterium]
MNSIQKLTEYFSDFPGIGPRQARRFVYHLLTRNPEYLQQLSRMIVDLKRDIRICSSCFRFFQDQHTPATLCDICCSPSRDRSILMIVSRDVDLENIEKTRSFSGLYFVLGGAVPILEKNPETRIRQRELLSMYETRAQSGELKEVIMALNATAEGENTIDYLENLLKPQALEHSIKISHLGRGISTGTELEYSDSDTIKNALNNRK